MRSCHPIGRYASEDKKSAFFSKKSLRHTHPYVVAPRLDIAPSRLLHICSAITFKSLMIMIVDMSRYYIPC